MPFILILLLFAVAAYLIWLSQQKTVTAVSAPSTADYSHLPLRRVGQAIDPKGGYLYAIVFLNGIESLSIEQIIEQIQSSWPDHCPMGPLQSDGLKESFSTNKGHFSFELVAHYDDHNILKSACKDDHFWPDANKQLAEHRLAVVVGAKVNGNAFDHCVLLSQAISAITHTCSQVSGVLWTPCNQLICREVLLASFDINFKDQIPVNLWVKSRAYLDESGRTIGYTQGLDLFDQVDFEAVDAPESPHELRLRLMALIDYSILHCNTLFNGDTVGIDEVENIKLSKRPSAIGNKGWVFQMDYLRPSDTQPWRK